MRDNTDAHHVHNFIEWYNGAFKKTSLYKQMEATTEDSPHHREGSVAIHTDMVVMNLLMGLNKDTLNARSMLNGLFAAAFHDVGKPATREMKHSEERGIYYAYHGHELRSARAWEQFYLENRDFLMNTFGINSIMSYVITIMIEWHRPWDIKDREKLRNIHLSLLTKDNMTVFHHLLMADNVGRIPDENNLTAARLKISNFKAIANDIDVFPDVLGDDIFWGERKDRPSIIIPVGVSGTGKSTLAARVMEDYPQVLYHSMDEVRAILYGDDPTEAFRASQKDSKFKTEVTKDFVAKIKTGESVYIDNTNISHKRRRSYLTEANRRDYYRSAFLFRMLIGEINLRQIHRGNKRVPFDSVMRQHESLSYPLIGEFDHINLV